MKFKDLDGKDISVSLIKNKRCKTNNNVSQGQSNLRACIEEIYPNVSIFEDFIIPNSKLSLDFYLPSRNIAFEFDGVQHEKFNSFFHKTVRDFLQQRIRDENKDRWCQLNEIILIRITDKNITSEELKPITQKAILKQKN